jgi:hypothetical protein
MLKLLLLRLALKDLINNDKDFEEDYRLTSDDGTKYDGYRMLKDHNELCKEFLIDYVVSNTSKED